MSYEIRAIALQTAVGLYAQNPLADVIAAAQTFASFLEHGLPEQGNDTGAVAATPKARRGAGAAAKSSAPNPEAGSKSDATDVEELALDDVDRELLAPVPPAPAGANAIVDAGTGKPAETAETVKMTFDDVKVAAAKLAAKDTPKLLEILTKFKAANLSGVPKDKLGEFAGLVMAELEADPLA